jgi:hypothetical protein
MQAGLSLALLEAGLRGAAVALDAVLAVLGPPGWRPDGKGMTTADLRREAALAGAG